ncbi:glycosyltransferase [Fontisphaera persica]|uniref:glycosyltransferase n=1 Tax=Fontisphaera persica TaxID=2974023 RepID=UPI0024BFCDC2|nr:glycosyltransferase [Fontisphaera persica]WCJ59703.1 glycosyltransferase [Fontisphaera persica]
MEIIHPGVDTTIFKPLDKELCRQMLQLPKEKVILCFGAASTSYKNKGLDFLTECINHSSLREKVFCLVFGSGGERLHELKCGWRFVGYNDSEHLMAAVYSASDIFVMPSRMETFGLTALEAMACGVPVIASKVGGLVDIILEEKRAFGSGR